MLQITDHGNVREIRLSHPPANALNAAMVKQLTRELKLAGDEADAVVISGLPGMFSAGLDVPRLLNCDRSKMIRFWKKFIRLLKTIAHMPVPTVFAMTGHAPAGGIVMAIFGDYRIMPSGNFKTGMNEVQVGLVVPPPVHKALVRAIGSHNAERILVAGEIMDAQKAKDIGLVDELAADPESTVNRAIEWCEQHIALPQEAMLVTRKMARADLRGYFDSKKGLGVEQFVDIWFSESTHVTLTALVERLTNK